MNTEKEIMNIVYPDNKIRIKYLDNEKDCPKSDLANKIIYVFNLNEANSREEFILRRFYVSHETAHILLTDLKQEYSNIEFQYLVNALEDLRINKYLSSLSDQFANDVYYHNLITSLNMPEIFPRNKFNHIMETIFTFMITETGFPLNWKLSTEANKIYNNSIFIFQKWNHIDFKSKHGFQDVLNIAHDVYDIMEVGR